MLKKKFVFLQIERTDFEGSQGEQKVRFFRKKRLFLH